MEHGRTVEPSHGCGTRAGGGAGGVCGGGWGGWWGGWWAARLGAEAQVLDLIRDTEHDLDALALDALHARLPPAIGIVDLDYLAQLRHPRARRRRLRWPQPRAIDVVSHLLALVVDERRVLDLREARAYM